MFGLHGEYMKYRVCKLCQVCLGFAEECISGMPMVIGLKKGEWGNRTDFPILEKLEFDVQASAECNV